MGDKLEENYEIKTITVDPKQSKLRIDKFLNARISSITRSKIQKSIKLGYTTVNDEEVKSNYEVIPGDIIKMRVPIAREKNDYLTGEDIPLNIVYEDEHILIVNKQAGLVVHPGHGNWTGTLVNGLIYYLDKQALPVMQGNSLDRPGIVHRIDKDTSGLLVIAKTELAMRSLSAQFYEHSIDRTYKAIVWGEPEDKKGTINAPIGRDPRNRLRMTTFEEGDLGNYKHAITHFKLLLGMYYVSLIECKLETGRTHQIRVHLASIGHPIFNDKTYGGDRIRKGTIFSKYKQFVQNNFSILPRQALHAASLGFMHPETGKRMEFATELPESFQKTIDRWNRYHNSRKNL